MFSITGTDSTLNCNFFPAIELNTHGWEIGLVNLCAYNSTIEKDRNNLFHYIKDGVRNEIVLDEGSYELDDIIKCIKNELPQGVEVQITGNTLRCKVEANVIIDFSSAKSVGSLFGFDRIVLEANKQHTSNNPVNIIRVECNIVCGSYNNGHESHTIHEFYPTVGSGFNIVESPSNIIYLPINVCCINNIMLQLLDQDGQLINFKGQTISARLHLRRRYESTI
jgi:hypothetical protein